VAQLDLTRPGSTSIARPMTGATTSPAPAGGIGPMRARLRRRLGVEHPEPAWWAWCVALVLGGFAAMLRFWRLGDPPTLMFDETYYVKQAYSLLLSGDVEWRWTNDSTPPADDIWNAGTLDVFTREGDPTIVHPPLGKWMIALGMRVFGPEDPASWRIASAICGALMVVILVLVARRLFDSTLLGGIAGFLLAIDGNHLTSSRIGLLDIFLAFWALVAFALLLGDRYWLRARLADRVAKLTAGGSGPPRYGPWFVFRPWLLAAGVALGAASAIKWSGLWFIVAFGLLVVAWDVGARHTAGIKRWFTAGVLRDGPIAFLHLVPVAFLTYGVTWIGWFRSDDGFNRYWARDNPDSILARLLPDPIASLAHWHQAMWQFHVNVTDDHIYQANPWSWLVQGRPTLFAHQDVSRGQAGCSADTCKLDVLNVGNPVIWWGGAIAIVIVALVWLLQRDWRAGAVLVPLAAGWLPWLMYQERTIFNFYSVAFVPYVVLALTFVLGMLLGPPGADVRRRTWGAALVGAFVVLATAVFVLFWPMWVYSAMTIERWQLLIWLPSWRQ